MAETNLEGHEVNARIVYWGVEGGGKSANLRTIHAKLRPDHRGSLRQVPTSLDPTVTFEVLPIELGEIGGLRTRIQTVAVPGSPEHAPTRKQLLDRADGIVLVIDSRRDQIDANMAAFEELRQALAAYGRSLEEVPIVLQYNKRDLSDAYALEELHRKLDVRGAAGFEAVATEGLGVIQTLTTISKGVIRSLRESGLVPGVETAPSPDAEPAPAIPPAAPTPNEPAALDLEAAALAAEDAGEDEAALSATRARALLDASWDEGVGELPRWNGGRAAAWRLVEVGHARIADERSVELPLVLDTGAGRELRVRLTLAFDPITSEDED